MSRNISLCPENECTGCAACYNNCNYKAIVMTENEEGFLFPLIDQLKCKKCGMCMNVCPQINKNIHRNEIQESYASYALDNRIREVSSSGGVFSVMASNILDNGGSVIGAYLDEKQRLSHILIDKKEDLYKLRGSKYIQSEIGYIYRNVQERLKQKETVLFVGTPCQIAGLRSFIKDDSPSLITCDIVCHGVPSHILFDKIVDHLHKKGVKYSNIYFRNYRRWSVGFFIKRKFKFGYYIQSLKDENAYFQFYLSGYANRECCYQCEYSNENRVSDITIADCWAIKKNEDLSQKQILKGISFIGVNTEKGVALIKSLKDELFLQKKDFKEIRKNNLQLNAPCKRSKERDEFYKNLKEYDWESLKKIYKCRKKKMSLKDRIGEIYRMIKSWTYK